MIFTSGTTDGINLVMHGYGRKFIGEGDEIILTTLEHHSNIVPWQMLAEEKGAKIRVVPINDRRRARCRRLRSALQRAHEASSRVSHVSNALGTINPVKEMIAIAHARGVPVLVDGAQAAPHLTVDVQDLDCDFYAFSGHKLCGPTGIGVLYGKAALLEKMQPFKGGGDMILSVTFEKTTYNTIPHKFEAGTPPIAAAIGLGAAIDYLIGDRHGRDRRARAPICSIMPPSEVNAHCRACASSAPPSDKAAVLSFAVEGVHPHDVGTLAERGRRRDPHRPPLRAAGDAALQGAGDVRARRSRSTTRMAEVDALVAGIRNVQKVFDDERRPARQLYQEVILDHNRKPRNCGTLARREPPGRRAESAVRRPPALAVKVGGRHGRGDRVPRRIVRDLQGVGVDDDDGGQRQDRAATPSS